MTRSPADTAREGVPDAARRSDGRIDRIPATKENGVEAIDRFRPCAVPPTRPASARSVQALTHDELVLRAMPTTTWNPPATS